MTDRERKKLEKMLYYVLGRRPDEFGLLPNEGFVRLKDLHKALVEIDGFKNIRIKKLKDFFLIFKPERFEYLEEQEIVRVKPEFAAPEIFKRDFVDELPQVLFTSVKPKAWVKVSENGLAAEKIILTPDEKLAQRIAKRRGALVVAVDTQKAMTAGAIFERFLEKLYVSTWIPAEALRGPKIDEAFKKRYLTPPKKEKKPLEEIAIAEALLTETTEEEHLPYRKITKGRKKDPDWKKTQRLRRRR
ncbi:RNA 2'-phosphotransferase family protein [Thermodesulfatator atlanticus]|uniref:hypothetical protein n=1 Tax=Thermodesulfatator atlanticus TaxID=501497 RepID=UPI0003B4D10A|nr:hypothetical protein [Thermodesulfatator atlanticus]